MSGAMLRAVTPQIPDPYAPSHRFYAEWNPARFYPSGPVRKRRISARLVEEILSTRPYPEQGYKTCLGNHVNLTRNYDPVRVEAAQQSGHSES